MRGYLGNTGTDVTPSFRASGHGHTRTVAQLSIPLRLDDLISILYHSPLTGRALTDADEIRATVLDGLVNCGGDAIARDKHILAGQIAAGSLDDDALTRLATCQRRIEALFPGKPDRLLSPAKHSPITRRVTPPRTSGRGRKHPKPDADDHAA